MNIQPRILTESPAPPHARLVTDKLATDTCGGPETLLAEEQPQRFLSLLDPSANGFTFQTFDDDRVRKNPGLTRIIQSPPPARDELRKLNEQGAGIFVTVNETDGNGRRSENIKRVRAIWQEDDDAFDGCFPLDPSIVVESSPGKYHRYWLVADDWPADEQGRADFAAVMERMVASYGCDKNAKDISRVLRVPGFLHRKTHEPHLVQIGEAGGRRYSRAQIVAAFPPVEKQTKIHPLRTREPRDDDEARLRDALNSIDADDRDLWLQCGMALKDELQEAGRRLWDEWSRRSDKYNERDQDATWRSLRRNGIGIGTLFHHAKMAGWRDERSHFLSAPRGASAPSKEPIPAHGEVEAEILQQSRSERPWPVLDDAALYGLAGDVVNTLNPHTEADPVGIIVQFLTALGNLIGNNAYYQVESDRHHANLFSVHVGASAKGRKGTAGGRVRAVTKLADETWSDERTASGLSSGEGLISAVRDKVEKFDAKAQQFETVDPGVADKRLMITEPEFAAHFRQWSGMATRSHLLFAMHGMARSCRR